MKAKTISIVMSVYNGQRHLRESIKSILSQTYRNFEFLIVDDASTDNSLKIINKYSKKDKRIKIIKNKKNIGLTRSLNRAIKQAKGKYIARQDADDFSEKNRLELQLKFLEKNKEIFLCGTGFSVVDNKSNTVGKIAQKMKYAEVEKKLRKMNCLCHGSIMFRNDRKTFYREKFLYGQDYDFYLTLLSRCKKLANLKKTLYNLRVGSSAISRLHGKSQFLFGKKAKEFYLERLKFKKDSYANFNPKKLIKLAKKYRGFTSFDYLGIMALLKSDRVLARKKIISAAIKNRKINLRLIKYFIRTFVPRIEK